MPRRACRRDANHNALSDTARRLGWLVWDTWQHAQYTPGWPDAVWTGYGVVFAEYKAKGGRLTDDERQFRALCEAVEPGLYQVFRTEEEVAKFTVARLEGEG